MLKTIAGWFRTHKLYTGLAIAGIGFILFLVIYLCINIAYVGYYGASASCTNSTKLGILISSPVNYCEDRIGYTTFQQGVDANAAIPALIIFFAILYSWSLGGRFKRYLSFKTTLIVSVLSTYALSALNLVFLGKPAGGTSIIAFDMLLFLLLGLFIDYTDFLENKKNKLRELARSQVVSLVISLNSLAKRTISNNIATIRVYSILNCIYLAIISCIAAFLLLGYMLGGSAPLHMSGGFILLLYVFLANRKVLANTV
ncbi:MAG: hypothetical protein QW530_01885 [Candidatus Micrarchaeaceae archaeon]